jgi:hypothetical protein
MKSTHALFACSLLSATCVFISCGSDDDKTKVKATPGGAGGEAGQAGESAGGSSFTLPGGAGGVPAVSEAGMGGVAVVPMGGVGGEGGEGGELVAPLCFSLDETAGGAGGAAPAAAAQGGAASQPLPFRCESLTGAYDAATRRITLDLLPGLEPAISGSFTAHHNVFESSGICEEGQVARNGATLELTLDSANEPYSLIDVFTMSVKDACGGSLDMDNSVTTSTGDCFGIQFRDQDGSGDWVMECYEGYGSDCDPGCVPPI